MEYILITVSPLSTHSSCSPPLLPKDPLIFSLSFIRKQAGFYRITKIPIFPFSLICNRIVGGLYHAQLFLTSQVLKNIYSSRIVPLLTGMIGNTNLLFNEFRYFVNRSSIYFIIHWRSAAGKLMVPGTVAPYLINDCKYGGAYTLIEILSNWLIALFKTFSLIIRTIND